jgi:plastocyanin
MAINFPDTTGQATDGSFTKTDLTTGVTWSWNGTSWAALGVDATTSVTVVSGISLTDLSISSPTSASGTGDINYDNASGVFTFVPPDLSTYAQTSNLATVATSGQYADLAGKPTLPTVTAAATNSYGIANEYNFGSSRLLYKNVWDTVNDLPSATTYHGLFAHVHSTGGAYYAHAGNWTELSTASTILDLNITDGLPNQVLTTDGGGNFTFEDAQGSGQSYNQTLNTTDLVTFSRVTADDFVLGATGPYVISAASYAQIDAQDGTRVTGGPFRLPNITTSERDVLIAANGDMIYNVVDNRIQAYQDGAWINIDDGSAPSVPVTYNATSVFGTVSEGSALTINVSTTNVADATTLYWTVTNAGDFSVSNGNFTITSNAGSFTVTPTADVTTEGNETFIVEIRTGSTSGPIVAQTGNITIVDSSTAPVPSVDSVTGPANVGEGSAATINVTTSNVPNGTTLNWSVSNAGDFGVSSGTVTINSNAGSFSVTPTADVTTEGSETFAVTVSGTVSSTAVSQTSSNITINDTSVAPAFNPDYTITISNSGNNYLLSGSDRNGSFSSASQPTLEFNSGDNVRFNVDVGTSSSHPVYIQTAQGTGGVNQVSGATGLASTQIDWTTATDGAGSYGYQCSIHFGMWNTITIN